MTKKEVEKWCKNNGYILISLKDKITIPKVKTIAEKSVNVASLNHKKLKHRNVFARHLAVEYLKDKYPRKKIAIGLDIKDSDVYNSERKIKSISIEPDFKKQWRNEAVIFFKNKIEEIESSL